MKKNNKYFLNENEFLLLREIAHELGKTTIAFLLSARSTKRFYKIKRELDKKDKWNIKRTINGLERDGYIKIKQDEIFLTEVGEKIFERQKVILNNKNKLKEKRKWDKKWRMISFDIPNDIQNIRNILRNILLRAGFLQIQKSVYIFPYDIKELLLFLKKNKEFKKYIIYSIICESTNSKEWLKEFKDIL